MSTPPKLMTVAETTVFTRKAADLLEDGEKDALINFLADNPEAGDLIRGSGGVRKLRWALEERASEPVPGGGCEPREARGYVLGGASKQDPENKEKTP